MRTITRGHYDNLLLAQAFENCLQFLIEKGFTSTRPFSQAAYGTLLLRYTGPFFIDIERGERLEVAIYIYPLHVDKPPSIKRIGIGRLIFMISECTEDISYIFPRFWDPLEYEKDAQLVCGKIQEYYERISWYMREENVAALYDQMRATGIEYMRSNSHMAPPHDHPA